jgi:transcriptional regulator with XRE-family HTH domain
MAPEQKQPKARPLGATGEAVRANISSIREAKRLPVTRLSAQLETLGRPIPPLGIRRIEAGERRVDVDDLMAFAIALSVSPASLLMPEISTGDKDGLVPITGWRKRITASHIWSWLTVTRPLVGGTLGSFIDHALPPWERERRLAEMGADDGDA